MIKGVANLTGEILTLQARDSRSRVFIGSKDFKFPNNYSIRSHLRHVRAKEMCIVRKNLITRGIKHFYNHTIFLEDLVHEDGLINMSGVDLTFRVRTKSSTDIKTLTRRDYIPTYELLNEKLQAGHIVVISHSWFKSWYRKDSAYPPNLIDIEEIRE